MRSGIILGCLLAISAWLWADSSPAVDFESLLGELTSRDTLAIHPAGRNPYDLLQASSYDRRAISPDVPGWFSNQDWVAPDRRNFLREEINEGRTEWVLMESQRPGAIVRFWGGGFPQNGTLRFYVDGASQPVLSGIASELLGRDVTGFGSVLSSVTVHLDPSDPAYNRAGFNLYAPIPYSKSMKVTYQVAPNLGDKRPNFWYNITAVPTLIE